MNSGEQKSAVSRSVTITYTAEAIPADDVLIETSPTLKYLRLRNGDYSCYKTVFLMIDGNRHGNHYGCFTGKRITRHRAQTTEIPPLRQEASLRRCFQPVLEIPRQE